MRTGVITAIAVAVILQHFPLTHASASGDQEKIATFFSLLERGNTFIQDEQIDSAAYYLNRGQALIETFDQHEDYYDSMHIILADAYFNLGERLRRKRDFRTAQEYHIKGLDLRLQFLPDNDPSTGDSYYYLALTHLILGEYNTGMKRVQHSLAIRKNAFGEMHEKVANSYNLSGIFYSIMNEYDRAHTKYEKALGIRKKLFGEQHSDVAASYNNLGIVARQRGDNDIALDYYYKAVAIRLVVQGEEHPLTAENYMNIGASYAGKEMYGEAIKYTDRALQILKSVFGEKDHRVALSLNNLGVIYRNAGDNETALQYLTRSLDIRRELFGDVHPDIGQSLNNIGVVYKNTGRYELALDYLEEAIEQRIQSLGRHTTEVADSYIYAGNIHRKMEDYGQSLSNYRNAIASQVPGFTSFDEETDNFSVFDSAIINRSLLRALAEKAQLYHDIYADAHRDVGPLYLAVQVYRAAGYITDLLRNTYTTEQSKLFLSEYSSDIFENAVHTSYQLYGLTGNDQHLHDAFSFAEHSRSLLLWESIIETRARLFAGIPEEILDEEREVHRQLIQTRLQYHRTRPDSEEFHSHRSDYFDALMNYRRFVAALESGYPRYYTLKHDMTSPSIPEVQSMLDEDTALLQYHLGKEKSFLFVMTSREFAVIPLGTAQTIDDLTHRMRRMIRRIDGDGFMTTSNALYSVLIEPALPYIKDKEQLIIIPDGSLNHLPFEALSADAVHDSEGHIVFSSLPYLIRDYTITYQYSMKLAFEKIVQNRKKITDTSHTSFIGLAPVFATDENERQPEGMSVTNDVDETRSSLQNFDLARFSVLPHSEREIHSIIELFGAENHHAEGYFHDDATKENFLNTIEDYSYIHIASHGFFYEEKPMLSGVLFSTGGDTDIDENRDILFAGEIYNLNLNSELIVLSSCESGIGTIARGEGILALTRGFIHAGAHNLLVSLWKITDRHTADLMYEFYRHVIAGESYPDALRNAKLHLIGREESSLPMLWSGFIMIGV